MLPCVLRSSVKPKATALGHARAMRGLAAIRPRAAGSAWPPHLGPAPPLCLQAFVEHYGAAPEVIVTGDASLTIPYIPAHLDYML